MLRIPLVVAAVALLLAPAAALGHATLVGVSPPADARLAAAPERVTLSFSEPVEVLRPEDLEVLGPDGGDAAGGPGGVSAGDRRIVEIPLRTSLPEGTYTVRYQVIGADSHVIPGAFVFGVGPGPLEPPLLAGAAAGPAEDGPWGVSARFARTAALGGLLSLLAFRWLVWGPAWRRAPAMDPAERDAALAWGRDAVWTGVGILAVVAMVAEGYGLVVQTARVLGTGVRDAVTDAAGLGEVLGETRFGSLLQLRGALLFGALALAAAQYVREYGAQGTPRAPAPTTGPRVALAIAALLLAALGTAAAQGHAGVAAAAPLQVGAQLVHVAAVAVWIGCLAMMVIAMARLPRVAPAGGPEVAARVLARVSRLALAAVAVAILTGALRSVVELSDPAELWETAYGRSIVYKLALLCPIALLALHNRRVVAALRRVARPNAPTLRLVRRTAGAELALSLGVVLVASLLAAQVPGAA